MKRPRIALSVLLAFIASLLSAVDARHSRAGVAEGLGVSLGGPVCTSRLLASHPALTPYLTADMISRWLPGSSSGQAIDHATTANDQSESSLSALGEPAAEPVGHPSLCDDVIAENQPDWDCFADDRPAAVAGCELPVFPAGCRYGDTSSELLPDFVYGYYSSDWSESNGRKVSVRSRAKAPRRGVWLPAHELLGHLRIVWSPLVIAPRNTSATTEHINVANSDGDARPHEHGVLMIRSTPQAAPLVSDLSGLVGSHLNQRALAAAQLVNWQHDGVRTDTKAWLLETYLGGLRKSPLGDAEALANDDHVNTDDLWVAVNELEFEKSSTEADAPGFQEQEASPDRGASADVLGHLADALADVAVALRELAAQQQRALEGTPVEKDGRTASKPSGDVNLFQGL